MSFNDKSAEAFNEGDIGAGWLIDGNGQQFWTIGQWEGFDPLAVVRNWQNTNDRSALVVGNLKFTIIAKDQERLVSTNVAGQGSLILAVTEKWPGGYLICWSPSTLRPDIAYSVVRKLADLISA